METLQENVRQMEVMNEQKESLVWVSHEIILVIVFWRITNSE